MARPHRDRNRDREERDSEFKDKLVHINRVAKVVKGGRRFSFNALVAAGLVQARQSLYAGPNWLPLSNLLGVQPSATGRMVDRLVAAGMIDRTPHPTSRRELLAALTKRGRDVVAKVTVNRHAEIARIVQKMPPRERQGMVRALTAFTAAGNEPDAHVDETEL